MRKKINNNYIFQWYKNLLIILFAGNLSACASVTKVTDIVDIPLQAIGVGRPSPPAPPSLPPPRLYKSQLEIHAAENLNADDKGRGLATVVHIYKLRNATTFMQAPYENFTSPEREKLAIGSDLIDVEELILTPGQQFESPITTTNQAPYIGIVALFRKPAPYRWRFVFKADEVEKTGIRIGAHACALTVTAGLTGNDVASRPLDQLPPFCR